MIWSKVYTFLLYHSARNDHILLLGSDHIQQVYFFDYFHVRLIYYHINQLSSLKNNQLYKIYLLVIQQNFA